MIGKAVLVIAAGLLLVWVGLRSASGSKATAEHLYGGVFEQVTCEDGNATGGQGAHHLSAERACEEAFDDQRGRAPLWIGAGLVVAGVGIFQFRRARAG